MNTVKLTEIFIGDGAALDAGATVMNVITSQIDVVGSNMTCLTAGDTISTAGRDSIFIVNKLANGDLKRSMGIKGVNVTSWKGESYCPSRRNVWGIGYQRGSLVDGVTVAAGGSISVSNSTDYEFSIRFKNDKTFYSERPEIYRTLFTSSATATQSNIADQIVSQINNSSYGSQPAGIKEIIAVKVGDGTGAYGLTGAANFGVEITGLIVNQFLNTTYTDNLVYFSVQVLDASGFGTGTSCVEIQSLKRGTGTHDQVYIMENKFYGNEGVLNRVLFPIPVLDYLTLPLPILSGTIAAFTSATTIGLDLVTFSAAANTQLPAGSLVVLDGVAYEIKYYISTTVAILVSVETSTNATGVVNGKAFYDVFNIEFTDYTTTSGAAVFQAAKKVLVIASPAIIAGATSMLTASTGTAALEAILNPWMTSTPLAPPTVTL
jgi:hypothetical protein